MLRYAFGPSVGILESGKNQKQVSALGCVAQAA